MEESRFPLLPPADFSVALGTIGVVEATIFASLLAADFSAALGAIGLVEATCPGSGACVVAVCAGLAAACTGWEGWSSFCFIWSTMARNCSISFCCSATCCLSNETSAGAFESFDGLSAAVCEKTGVARASKKTALATSMVRTLIRCILYSSDSIVCGWLGCLERVQQTLQDCEIYVNPPLLR